MAPSEDQLKELLLAAESRFDNLQQENDVLKQENEALQQENMNLSQSFFDLMEAQKMESEQMVQLNEQVWALEEALAMSREKALEQMAQMKEKFNTMNSFMNETLEAANKNASRIELAARVYEMSQVADVNDIDKQLEAFNEQLEPGKLKTP